MLTKLTVFELSQAAMDDNTNVIGSEVETVRALGYQEGVLAMTRAIIEMMDADGPEPGYLDGFREGYQKGLKEGRAVE